MTDTTIPDPLTRLLELALELGGEHDPERILRIATDGVCDAVGCERASLFLVDEVRQELYTRVVTELEIAEIRHPLDRGTVGWVATQRQLLSVPHPPSDPRWDASTDRKTGFTTRNILAAPVISPHDQRLLGVMQLLNKPTAFAALDERLVQAFTAHVAVALERRRLLDEAREIAVLRQTMEMGLKIQSTFLPDKLPDIPGYEVAAWWQPAEFVSGDYYDWFPLPDGRWGFAIGDVSGHGLAASLLMASVRAMVHVLVQTVSTPREFFEVLRNSIAKDLNHGRFITILFVGLDIHRHEVRTWNAGHGPAGIYHPRTGEYRPIAPTTTPLGFPSVDLSQDDGLTRLDIGDLVMLGTDGVIEVRNADGEMFGHERLQQMIEQYAVLPAAELVSHISAAVRAFHGRPLPPDDTTLVVIRRAK
ncbi:MAG TPA: GAF domain-containing SpoIIE family protein phosphatase [Planctomycetaceae bacterium]|nr:GAF domain-containing SpoIIE family protein phosphatase [Planctomycetaceae bacterium]